MSTLRIVSLAVALTLSIQTSVTSAASHHVSHKTTRCERLVELAHRRGMRDGTYAFNTYVGRQRCVFDDRINVWEDE
jgi:hypothetical protein